jgi:RNA polymerase sigma factor (sigma-70 family)
MRTAVELQIQALMPQIKAMAWRSRSRGGQHLDIDDLIQAGCIAVWRAIEKHDPSKGSFDNYVAVTIRGHIFAEIRRDDYLGEYLRQKAKRGEFAYPLFVQADDVPQHEMQETRTPCDVVESRQCLKFIPLLPERWQHIIRLRYEEDKSWPEVGEALGCSSENAKQTCYLAQKKLRSWMAGRVRPLAKHAGRRTA